MLHIITVCFYSKTLKVLNPRIWMPLMSFDGIRVRANAWKGVNKNATLISDCWPICVLVYLCMHTVKYGGALGPYRTVSYCDILCSIVSYPSFVTRSYYHIIMPSLLLCLTYSCDQLTVTFTAVALFLPWSHVEMTCVYKTVNS